MHEGYRLIFGRPEWEKMASEEDMLGGQDEESEKAALGTDETHKAP